MMSLSSLGMPVRFVRYNPDAFKGRDPGTAVGETLVSTVRWSLCRRKPWLRPCTFLGGYEQ